MQSNKKGFYLVVAPSPRYDDIEFEDLVERYKYADREKQFATPDDSGPYCRILVKFGDGSVQNEARYVIGYRDKGKVNGWFAYNSHETGANHEDNCYGKYLENKILSKFDQKTNNGNNSEFHNIYINGVKEYSRPQHYPSPSGARAGTTIYGNR